MKTFIIVTIVVLMGLPVYSQQKYYTTLKKDWDKIVQPEDFSKLRIIASSVRPKKTVNSDNTSYYVHKQGKPLFDSSKSKADNKQISVDSATEPDIYVDLSCLNESRPGIPVVFQIRVVLLHRYTWENQFDRASYYIRKYVDMYTEFLSWEYTDNNGNVITEQVYSPSFFSNEPNPDNIMKCGLLDRGLSSSTWFDLMPGTVFTAFFSVPSPAQTNIKQLKLCWDNLSCDVPVKEAFDSEFVGNSESNALNYGEFQNLLLFSQLNRVDPCFYPFGDWTIENHLSPDQIEKFEIALRKKDVYALMLYYPYFAINHISLHKIKREYLPPCSQKKADSLIRVGTPYKFGTNPPSELEIKSVIEISKYLEPLARSSSDYYPCTELPFSNWNWEIIRPSYNPEIIGNWDVLPASVQINMHKFLFDRKKQSHSDLRSLYVLYAKLYNFCYPEKHKALKEFMAKIYKIALIPSNLDLHREYNNTLPLD